MRFGVVLPESVVPDRDATPRAYEAFAERSRLPEYAVLWCREWALDPETLEALRAMGMDVLLYVEQKRPLIDVDVLRRFAQTVGDGAHVRINQEPDGRVLGHWQDWDPRTYAVHWSGCRTVLRSEADIDVVWAVSNPRKAFSGWWPGEADIVAVDRYAWTDDDPMPQVDVGGPCKALARLIPGVPVWVTETGSKVGMKRRAERLRALADVPAEVVVVMNLTAPRPDGVVDHWEWTPAMDRSFAGMVA